MGIRYDAIRALRALLISVALAGCGSDGGGSGGTSSTATFQRIQTEVFDVSCALPACHSSVAQAGGLILEEGLSWEALVDSPPTNAAARENWTMRVMPGHPDESFLLAKLTGNLAAGEGLSMPHSGPLMNPEAVEIIEAWIRAGAPREGVVPGDDGRPLVSDGQLADYSELPPPPQGVQLRATAPPVPRGKDETTCHYFKLPSGVDIDVNRIQIGVKGGSHHIHLYRPLDSSLDLPDHTEVCNNPVDFEHWSLVFATQSRYTDWELPEGVAYHFFAGQQLLMQTHFNNVGSLSTEGEGKATMNLHATDPASVRNYAGALWGQDRDVFVPRRSVVRQATNCVFPREVNLIAETGHYHFRGRLFDTYRVDDGVRGESFYHHEGYDEPTFVVHDPPIRFASGQGLGWECEWENNEDRDFKFGPSTDENEHCFLFAFYYPAAVPNESIVCHRENGVETTLIRDNDGLDQPLP